MNINSHLPLCNLAIDEVANVRRTGRGVEPIFVASIRAKGIIEPLTVRPNGKGYKVVNGGKRLSALQWMAEHAEIAAGVLVTDVYPVPVTIRDEGDTEARDTSLITNVVRAGMHPVDEFEAFAALVDGGMPVADVAARYALDERQVRQRLALGQLAPKIREAWRAGEIDASQAKAFTLGADHADQERVFDKLSKSGRLRWHGGIQEEFQGKGREVGQLAAFLGPERLRAAGIAVRADLFGDNHVITDPEAVKKLAADTLAAECERLKGEGWSWASLEEDLPQGARWSWSTLPPKKAKPKPNQKEKCRLAEIEARIVAVNHEPADDETADEENAALLEEKATIEKAIASRAYSAEDKARSGCIVGIGHRGELEVKYAVLDPKAAKAEQARQRAEEKKAERERRAAAGEPVSPEEPAGPDISNALAHDLSCRLTLAVQEAMVDERHVALAALLAGFLCSDRWNAPVHVSSSGYGAAAIRGDEEFADLFARFQGMTIDDLLAVVGRVTSGAIGLESHNASHPPLSKAAPAAVANAIDGERLELALRSHFDPEDFFKRASAGVALAAIAEMGLDKGKASRKPDLVAIVVAGARQKGWLPMQMRTAHYAGPGAKSTPAPLGAEPEDLGDVEDDDEDLGEE
jgi:ParB family chromosome partitioning protein